MEGGGVINDGGDTVVGSTVDVGDVVGLHLSCMK